MRTLRSKAKRNALLIAANGKCCICNVSIVDKFHADHIIPWSISRTTNVHEMQALCAACNLSKGVRYETP